MCLLALLNMLPCNLCSHSADNVVRDEVARIGLLITEVGCFVYLIEAEERGGLTILETLSIQSILQCSNVIMCKKTCMKARVKVK
ncbi:hypothetical protein ABFS82_05G024000 [Erythranthe guttata]